MCHFVCCWGSHRPAELQGGGETEKWTLVLKVRLAISGIFLWSALENAACHATCTVQRIMWKTASNMFKKIFFFHWCIVDLWCLKSTAKWLSYTLLLFLVTGHIQLFCDPMDCSLPGSSVHGTLPGKSHGQRSLEEYTPWGCIRVGHDWMTMHAHNNYWCWASCWPSVCLLCKNTYLGLPIFNWVVSLVLRCMSCLYQQCGF